MSRTTKMSFKSMSGMRQWLVMQCYESRKRTKATTILLPSSPSKTIFSKLILKRSCLVFKSQTDVGIVGDTCLKSLHMKCTVSAGGIAKLLSGIWRNNAPDQKLMNLSYFPKRK